VGDDISVDSDVLLMTDFINFKIKSAQSFGGAHRIWCACVHRSDCSYVYEYVCTVFLKNERAEPMIINYSNNNNFFAKIIIITNLAEELLR
jgi:hypothetical protein